MARKQATPEVEQPEVEEMVDRGVTQFGTSDMDADFPDDVEIEDAEAAETPTPSAMTSESTSRRSQDTAKSQAAQPVNLDDIPDFRAWKSKMDQQLAQANQDRQRLESERQQWQAQQAAAQMSALNQQLTEVEDPGERQVMIDQMAALKAQNYMTEWQRWQTHVAQRVTTEGLDVAEFNPLAYQGQAGAMQFELDVAAKKTAKLERELKTAKQAADPETLAGIVAREVAKALQAQGYNQTDLGAGPQSAGDPNDQWERDKRLLQQGKLPRGYMAKKYGGATP
jgi:hypothetical protein